QSIEEHLPYNPLLVLLLKRYHFFNATTLRCCALMGLFAIFVDYGLYFKMDHRLGRAISELVVENGQHFIELNEGRFRAEIERQRPLGRIGRRALRICDSPRCPSAVSRIIFRTVLYKYIWSHGGSMVCNGLKFHTT